MRSMVMIAVSFLMGMSLAGKTYLPLVASPQQNFNLPIEFEGRFEIYEDGSGLCQGEFAVDWQVWKEFLLTAQMYDSTWHGLAELFDGSPYGIDEDHPMYNALWDIADALHNANPWPAPFLR